jgi:L-ascorbate metabolism protein UlaG (beta-lactamase superfamily)
MEISWFGHSCFQLRGKNVTLITDPFTPQQGPAQSEPSTLGNINASIVTVSHNHPGHNFAQGVGGHPRVVHGPGEYEISDVLLIGVPSYHDNQRGKQHGRNTIYVIHMDDLVICHLGDIGHTLQEEQLEEVADADILLLPIGGGNSINATQAVEIISQVEPHVIIPMHYSLDQTTESSAQLNKFMREMGGEPVTPLPKYTVTRNSLPATAQVVLLTPRE